MQRRDSRRRASRTPWRERDAAREAAWRASNCRARELRTEMAALASDLERMHSRSCARARAVDDVLVRARDARERERVLEATRSRRGAQRRRARRARSRACARARGDRARRRRAARSERIAPAICANASAALTAERDASTRTARHARSRQRARAARARADARGDRRAAEADARRARARRRPAARRQRSRRASSTSRAASAKTMANGLLQLEADLRSAENDEREAVAGGERHRTRLAEIEAELGMLVSQFAQNPGDRRRVSRRRGSLRATRPTRSSTICRGCAKSLRGSRPTSISTPRPSAKKLRERETFLRTQLDDLAKARETLLESIKEIEAAVTSAVQRDVRTSRDRVYRDVRQALPRRRRQDVADQSRESLRNRHRDLGAAARARS